MRGKALALGLAVLGMAGCGNSGVDSTPDACGIGMSAPEAAASYAEALPAAPGPVKLDGGVLISDCLVEGQSGGELSDTGGGMVLAATKLNQEARSDPGSPAPTELGYLVGAAQRGADDTGGIHADLLRRLTTAAQFTPRGQRLSDDFQRGYSEGFAAGKASG